mmetsp:Transcript_77262/g.165652  ORF Transcript_77262/g.165652 Transcript_77262/m.165652 type:complete len:260 (-) Transcript_77262:479-1258(-)
MPDIPWPSDMSSKFLFLHHFFVHVSDISKLDPIPMLTWLRHEMGSIVAPDGKSVGPLFAIVHDRQVNSHVGAVVVITRNASYPSNHRLLLLKGSIAPWIMACSFLFVSLRKRASDQALQHCHRHSLDWVLRYPINDLRRELIVAHDLRIHKAANVEIVFSVTDHQVEGTHCAQRGELRPLINARILNLLDQQVGEDSLVDPLGSELNDAVSDVGFACAAYRHFRPVFRNVFLRRNIIQMLQDLWRPVPDLSSSEQGERV